MTREEAIKWIKNSPSYHKDHEPLNMAIQALEQEPKIGHWIMTSDYYLGAYGSIDYVKCSCCGEESLEEGNFCPNCGAKMVEPQESEG